MKILPTEIWIGHYSLNISDSEHSVALGYADSRDDFTHLVNVYCAKNNIKPHSQLAPLPLKTWIKRHGMQDEYQSLVEQLSVRNPFIFVSEESLLVKTGLQKNYLITQTQSITPVERQWGVRFPHVVPQVLNDSFFCFMDWYADYADEENAPKINKKEGDNKEDNHPNYYLVIDGFKSVFFPSLFINNVSSTRCLFTGEAYERLEEKGPYLVQINPGEDKSRDFVKNLFTQHDNEMFGFWDLNPNIFIRSYYDFDTIYNHVRKFTHLKGKNDFGENKWFYFRFYDPTVLSSYLQKLSHYPDRLKTWFGVNENAYLFHF